MADVIVDGRDLALIGIGDVLGGDVGRLAQSGIIAGDDVGIEGVGIVGAAEDLLALVPVRDQAVLPPGWIAVLLTVDQEARPLLDQGLQRLGDEELEDGRLLAGVSDRQQILS